jgi:hypothetical protein
MESRSRDHGGIVLVCYGFVGIGMVSLWSCERCSLHLTKVTNSNNILTYYNIWLPYANLAIWQPDCPIARLGTSIWHGFYLASLPTPKFMNYGFFSKFN